MCGQCAGWEEGPWDVCVSWLLRVVVSRVGSGDCVCVAPVWGLMVGVDDDGRQRWKLSVGLFACLCGVVAMVRLCCVCGCGCDGVWCDGIVCLCVFGLWCGQSSR